MPLDRTLLEARAKAFTASMTSIRGRRVQRLVLREFLDFDAVVPAVTADGRRALFAVGARGSIAVCCTDGTGPIATVVRGNLAAASVETAHDLLKDSLTVVSWSVRHPAMPAEWMPLAIAARDLQADWPEEFATLLATGTTLPATAARGPTVP